MLTSAQDFLSLQTSHKTSGSTVCGCGCNERLTFSNSVERQAIDGKPVTDDCYWNHSGDALDSHAVGHPGTHHIK